MAQIAKKTKRYPSDLTDEEWERIAPLMPVPGRRGRPREVEFREVINAVRYLVRSGCGWRMLPVHFGPWQTVYGWFRELARRLELDGERVRILGSAAERPLLEEVGRGTRAEIVAAADPAQLPAAASGCPVAVTNDSGLLHIAEACGSSVVAIFGPITSVA